MNERAAWREVVAPGEAERLEALARRLVGEGARDGRPLHRKALLGVRGRFEVGEVPPELEDAVRKAASQCPSNAISLSEDPR